MLSRSVCAQVAQARALKEIIVSMILRNGKTIRLCVGIFMIVMFAHFFGLIEVILVILVSSLGLVFISLKTLQISKKKNANRQRNSPTDNLLAASSPTESTNHVFLLHYKTVDVIGTSRHL